jgi:hypothetical protein
MPQETRNLVAPLGRRFGLTLGDIEECAQRLCRGMEPDKYGPLNHLQPEYDVIGEALPELYDAFNQLAPMGVRRAKAAAHGKLPMRDLVFGDSDLWVDACQHIAFVIRLLHQLRQEQVAPPDEEL